MEKFKFQIDKKFHSKEFLEAKRIISILKENNFKAYLVGGCVRDLYLGIMPKDFDVVTNATPKQIKKLFKKVVCVGEQFGIIIVVNNGIHTEVATFRKDINYYDGRHPSEVIFSDEKEDVLRRDFTINALLYDIENEEIIDYVNGINDINNKIIRAIGDPYQRFNEDKLRVLRAIRFSVRFNFQIEETTYQALLHYREQINIVSKERIRDELNKIFNDKNPDLGFKMLFETELIKYIIPEVNKYKNTPQPPEFHPEGNVYNHIYLMLQHYKNEKKPNEEFVWAIILHDVGKPFTINYAEDRIRFHNHDVVGAKIATKICENLKFSNKQKEYIVNLVRDHMKFIAINEMRLSTKKKLFRLEYIEDLILLLKLDILGSFGDLSLYNTVIKEYENLKKEILKPPPLIRGRDLIALGFNPSPLIGKILYEIEEMQLEGILKTKEEAINYVKEKYLTQNNSK